MAAGRTSWYATDRISARGPGPRSCKKPIDWPGHRRFMKCPLPLSPVSTGSSLIPPQTRPYWLFSRHRCAILRSEQLLATDDIVIPARSLSRSAKGDELHKPVSPPIFLGGVLVFLVLCGLITVVLYKQII